MPKTMILISSLLLLSIVACDGKGEGDKADKSSESADPKKDTDEGAGKSEQVGETTGGGGEDEGKVIEVPKEAAAAKK